MFRRAGDKKTPKIEFDSEKGTMEISGISIPENPHDVYAPLVQAIQEYKESPEPITKLQFKLYYFNTSTSKYVLDILRYFIDIKKSGLGELEIEWCYQDGDDDMLEIGEDFEDLLSFPFTYTSI